MEDGNVCGHVEERLLGSMLLFEARLQSSHPRVRSHLLGAPEKVMSSQLL